MFEVKIIRADTGGFVFVTPTKCLQVPTLETVLSEVRSAFRQNNEGVQQELCPCPYCGSTDTIGHGLRETGKQVLTRRFCKSCNKTWVSGREQRIAASTKEQVAFLKFLEYSEKDITELVHRSKSTVRAHIENIEIAKYRTQKQAEAEHIDHQMPGVQISKGKADELGKPNVRPLGEDKNNGAYFHRLPEAVKVTKSEREFANKPHCPRSADLHDEPEPVGDILAPEFDRAQAPKERIGNFTVWNYNGRLAASEKGRQEVIYLAKDGILHMKTLRKGRHGKQKLGEYLQQVPGAQRKAVEVFIETLIDEDLGMFPMLRAETRVGDSGEIDAGEHEEGGYINTGGGGE